MYPFINFAEFYGYRKFCHFTEIAKMSRAWSAVKKLTGTAAVASGVGAGALVYNFEKQPLMAGELLLHPPKQNWFHKRMLGSYDTER